MAITFKIIILSQSPAIPDVDCENGCVFISNNALINKIRVKSKDWVKVWIKCGDNGSDGKKRFSQIFAIDSIEDEEVAFISPQLWFNLQSLSSHKFKAKPLLQPNTTLMISQESPPRNHLQLISCVNIALIQSPDYGSRNDFSVMLKKYFDIKRYVMKNDVIGISTRDDPLYHSSAKDLLSSEWPVVYFRVTLVEGEGCLVYAKHSKLYQSGTVRSPIPASLPWYYSPKDCLSLEANPMNCGQSRAISDLGNIVMPYLMAKNRVVGTILVTGPSGSGKKSIIRSVCKLWNLNLYQINCNEIIGETLTQTETRIKSSLGKASLCSPTVVLISEISLLSNNELYDESRITSAFRQSLFDLVEVSTEWPIVVIATNSENKKFSANELNSLFVHSLEVDCPTSDERDKLLRDLIGDIPIGDIDFDDLSRKTVGFYLGDLKTLVSKSIEYLYEELSNEDSKDNSFSQIVLTDRQISRALEDMQRLHSDAIGSASVPNVDWDDIGGHEQIKNEILDTIQLPLECPQLLSLGFKRSGILLYGPPGTGKTLLAKAAASQCSLNFLSVKGPELINMFVGQSEENVRNVFARARKCAPAVIFFDELDSLAPNRGKSGDSGGVMDRVVSQLLAEMDGINKANDVFVIGATNRLDLLDTALLRPGRFDRLLFVGISNDSKSRLQILRALTRKFEFDSDVDLQQIESRCPSGLSGADFYAICADALMKAIQRCIELLDSNSVQEEECRPVLQLNDFLSVFP